MTRSYKKLWHMLLDRDMSRTQLRELAGISTNALAKLGRDESLPLETLEKVCAALGCTLDDILEYIPDEQQAEHGERNGQAMPVCRHLPGVLS